MRPLGACMIPVMLGALTAMLMRTDPIGWLYWGFPIALLVAAAWTVFQLLRRTVEVQVRGEAVRVLSAWEVAGRTETAWVSVLDVDRRSGELIVTLGHDTRRLEAEDWPDLGRVERALESAWEAFSGRVRQRLGADRPGNAQESGPPRPRRT